MFLKKALLFGIICSNTLISCRAFVGSQYEPLCVAFTLGQKNHVSFQNGDVMAYDHVITNINADIQDGLFTCQYSGIYAFHVYALARSDKKIWFEIYRNDDYVASLYGRLENNYADSGNSVVMRLDIGDRVYVRSREGAESAVYAMDNEVYATFTGLLIHSDDQDTLDLMGLYPVAFSAGLSDNVTLRRGETLRYDRVITNDYEGYDNTTGVFTCPQPGHYIFHFHSLSQASEEAWLELYHNDYYVDSLYGYTAAASGPSANTAILNLDLSDTVKIKGHVNLRTKMFGAADQVYSTFSGFMLSPNTNAMDLKVWDMGDQGTKLVAFSVGLTHTKEYSEIQKVTFDRIFTNIGNSLDLRTGVFTAPQTGVYVFHFHAVAKKNSAIWLELFHNYQYVVSLFGYSLREWGSGSNAAVLRLTAGDVVFVQSRPDYGAAHLYGKPSEVYCTFSGYLLSPMLDVFPLTG